VLVVSKGQQVLVPTDRQVKNPPVGSGTAAFTPFSVRLERPWKVLAMSDGVWKYVGWERVRRLALGEHGQALLDHLQQAARLRGSGKFQDDFTAVLFQERDHFP
jgi:hypothetical protein